VPLEREAPNDEKDVGDAANSPSKLFEQAPCTVGDLLLGILVDIMTALLATSGENCATNTLAIAAKRRWVCGMKKRERERERNTSCMKR
jgi:hypothetical protein